MKRIFGFFCKVFRIFVVKLIMCCSSCCCRIKFFFLGWKMYSIGSFSVIRWCDRWFSIVWISDVMVVFFLESVGLQIIISLCGSSRRWSSGTGRLSLDSGGGVLGSI